jgi:phage terminase large subunit-like protein
MAEMGDGPDPNDLRRHAKKIYTEAQYRKKYRRIDFYKPNLKQLAFHNALFPERMLRAGNQQGKTQAAAAELAMHATQIYPEWKDLGGLKGRRFMSRPKIERPFDFLAWAAAPNGVKIRDGMQTKLLGDLSEDGGLGTGMIPLDNIGKLTMARGIGNLVDTASLKREDGGKGAIRFKTYEQGRQAFEGEAVDVISLDEDVKGEQNGPIYSECQARTTTTRGIIMVTMTALLGLTPIRRRFKERKPGTHEILMTIQDALVSNGGHIPDEDLPRILSLYKAHEVQTRVYGADMQGEGAVFETPVEQIKHDMALTDIPAYWPWLWALDFRHSGNASSGHPFAAVLGCWNRDSDTIYVMHAVRMLGLAPVHVAAIKQHPMWPAPVSWPHDGGRGGSIVSGDTIAATYKKLGLSMRPTHAVFPENMGGNFDFEGGITDMENRFAQRRLLVARHLTEVFDEYGGYHRVNGLVNKIDDDLMSAIRVLCMDIRNARSESNFPVVASNRSGSAGQFAVGTPSHPDGDMDVFTGG